METACKRLDNGCSYTKKALNIIGTYWDCDYETAGYCGALIVDKPVGSPTGLTSLSQTPFNLKRKVDRLLHKPA